jgi:hypothetical protein
VVNYVRISISIFKCSWIPTNFCGNTKIVWQDENGLWMVNFQCWLPPMVEPYVFHVHVFQV